MNIDREEEYGKIINFIKSSQFNEALNLLIKLGNSYSNDINFNNLIGFVYQNLEDYVSASKHFQNSYKLDNNNFDTNFNIGILNFKQKKFHEAEVIFLKLSKHFSDNKDVFYNLGIIKLETNEYDKAKKYFEKALYLDRQFYFAQHHLGECYEKLNNDDLAISNYKKAQLINLQGYNNTLNNLGNIFLKLKNYDLAKKYFIDALKFNGNKKIIYNNLSILYLDILEVEKAYDYLQKSLSLDGNDPKILSRLISTSLYLNKDINTYKKISEDYRDILSKKRQIKENKHKKSVVHSKILKIGFVSADFREHPVGYYLLDFLGLLKKFSCEIYAYSNSKIEDNYTKLIKKNFFKWNNIASLSDEEICSLIKNDQIDLLIDMSGHSGDNRLSVFQLRPAPIQISWAAYLASTGLQEIDYIVGDPYVMPINDSKIYTEKILQFKDIWCCLSTSDIKNINPSDLPALKNGYITFGCFNNVLKVNENFINVCSKILSNVKNSKIIFKSPQLSESINKEKIYKLFAKNFIEPSKVILDYDVNRIDLLKSYNKIDIALDTFPYSGGTTSFELSWMCVPLLTKKGDRFISRCGESINNNLGMEEWIAENEDDYVNKAVLFCKDIKKLEIIKKKLIQHSRSTNLFNMNKFAKEFIERINNICASV